MPDAATTPTSGAPVLVTGAAGALGQAVLRHLASLGRPAVAFVRGDADAAALRAEGTWARAVDLRDEASVAAAVAAAVADRGAPAGALLLAGGFATAAASATDLGQLRRQYDLNVATAATVVRALLPALIDQGHGTLVGIGAGQARRGGARTAAYAAAKAALATYLRAVDAELAPQGVRATTVFVMGTLDTAANRAAMPSADPRGWIDPAQVARVLVQAIDLGPRARWQELEVHADAT